MALAAVLMFGFAEAQDLKNWKNLDPEKRKELINKMTPEERMDLLKEFRENMLVDELHVPENKQKEFKSLYNEYQESQRKIKENFKAKTDYDNMNDAQAKIELEQSFEVGQQLLDNRKKYSKKFQEMMKPQQVLQMFQNEGMMRSKVMDRKLEDREQRGRMQNNTRDIQDRGRQLQEQRSTPQIRNSETIRNNGVRPQSRRP